MTTAYDTIWDGLFGTDAGSRPWGQGAGHVDPTAAADPGLVFLADATDYKKYLCGLGMADQCAEGSIKGYNLNMPSITVSKYRKCAAPGCAANTASSVRTMR